MKHFTIDEMCKSSYAVKNGITNLPGIIEINNLENLVKYILDPAREKLGLPISINSGYRSKRLNDAIGGVASSQHIKGEAADITCANNRKLFNWIMNNYQYDQLINENNFTWIHVSFRLGNNRKQVFNMNNDE